MTGLLSKRFPLIIIRFHYWIFFFLYIHSLFKQCWGFFPCFYSSLKSNCIRFPIPVKTYISFNPLDYSVSREKHPSLHPPIYIFWLFLDVCPLSGRFCRISCFTLGCKYDDGGFVFPIIFSALTSGWI